MRGAGVHRHGPDRHEEPDTRDAGWKIKARIDGFDLDASVVVAPDTRARRARLASLALRALSAR